TARDHELVELPVPRAAPGVLAMIALVAAVAGIRDVAGDRAVRAALRSLDRGDPAAAGRQAARAVASRPDVVRYRLAAARAAASGASAAADDRALTAVAGALRVSPRDPVAAAERAWLLLDRASRTLTVADIDQARLELHRLTAADPC